MLGGCDQPEIVDAGRLTWLRWFSLWHQRVHMAPDRERDGAAHVHPVGIDPDGAEVLGVEAQLDVVPDQGGVDRVAIGEEGHGRGLRDSADQRPAEGLGYELGTGPLGSTR